MAKTRTRRGARRNLTRRGGGKGTMNVEKSKAQHSVKAKPYNYGKKPKIKRPLTKAELIRFIEKKLKERI